MPKQILAFATFACVALAFTTANVYADTVPANARAIFDKAEVLREEGNLEKAAEAYVQAIEAHPSYDGAHAGYLACLRGIGDLFPARKLYAKLASKHPNVMEVQVFAAACQEPKDALPALGKICDDFPGLYRAWVEWGRLQLSMGETKAAEASFKAAIKVSSDNPLAHTLLGDVSFSKKKYSGAYKAYNAARELDKSYIPAQLRWAHCRHRMNKTEEGLKVLNRLVAEDNLPRLVAGWWMIAVIQLESGKTDEAMKAIDTVLTIDKGDLAASLIKGTLLLKMEKPTEATKVFAEAVKANENSAEALFCLGWAYEKSSDAPEIQEAARKERLQKAAEAYEKCTSVDPGVRPRDSLGFVYLLGDLFEDAVRQFERATDLDKKFAPAANNLGLADDLADNRAAAKQRYEIVLKKIDRYNVRALVMLALDLWLDGNATKALKSLEKAVKIDPKDDLAFTFIGDIHYDNKKVNSAIKAYQKAVALNDANFFAWYHMGIAYDEDKRKYEEAEKCYEKAFNAEPSPPLDLLLRLGSINDIDVLDRPEKALQYYQAYIDAGGTEEWIPERIEDLKELAKGGG